MALRECGNGHVYDADQHAACPYCNSGRNMISFEKDSRGNVTMSPDGYNATRAPQQSGAAQIYPERLGKTVAPEEYQKRIKKENRTVGIFEKKYNLEPVVGWLVCIEGPGKGKDYHLWARINSIGRSEDMDVCLSEDMTISKRNHARIAYDSKHNMFQLIPGDSTTNTIYLNDEPVYIPAKLKAYDVIELGEGKFVFIPFCNERFNWTSGLKEGE